MYYQGLRYKGHQFGYDYALEMDIKDLEGYLYSLPDENYQI